ncbi:uncharacterized protein LOC119732419 [Patiria miniata]|uniref:Uncharacterized protein n=1 Tax=Patiria miniata TaxID=46514 RepID=A0A914ADG2_PATMI|nr:uncharacterized protein LOC119732419 [Patiria miniata]
MGCAASSSSTLTVSSCQEDASNYDSASSVIVTKDVSNRKTLSNLLSSETSDSWTVDIRQPAGDKPRHADHDAAIKLVSLTSLERYPERVLPQQPTRRYRGQNATGVTKQKTQSEERAPVLFTSITNPNVLAYQSFPAVCHKDYQTASRKNQIKRGPPTTNCESSSLPSIHRRFRCSIKFLPPLRFRKVRSDEPVYRAFRRLELPISSHYPGYTCKQTSSDVMDGESGPRWDVCGYSSTDVSDLQEMSDFEVESKGKFSPPEFQMSEASSRSDSIAPTRIIPREFARVLSSDSSFGDKCNDENANEDSKYFSEDVEADQASTHPEDTFSSPCEDLSTPSILSLLNHVDGSNSSEDMSGLSSAYPMSSDSESSRDTDLSDEGFSDASCTLGAVDLSNLHIMPQFLDSKLSSSKLKHPADTPILYNGGISASDLVSKRDRGLGDNLKSSTSRPLLATSPLTAAKGRTIGQSASFQATNRCSTKRSHHTISSMVSGDHIQLCDPIPLACGYANIHLHVNFFNDFGDNFDDELDFL